MPDLDQLFSRLIFVLLTSISMLSVSEDCSFPKSWHGLWLEGGKIPVEITSTEFSTKGVCFNQHKDYFLVENRLEHCHRCLLITTRHQNAIEYQQSYCIGRQSLQSICAQILVSSNNVFMLVREAAVPVPCPFQKSFHFIYNNNSLCYCRTPMSYLHHCTDPSRMVFGFRKCRSCALTEDKELTFECLAAWENGREFYSIGAFLSESSIRQSYHCFLHHMYDSVMYIVMSTKVTCQGFLRYPKEGQLTMELTEDVYGWPPASCTFPTWLSAHAWKDLYDVIDYSFSNENDVMFREKRRHIEEYPVNETSKSALQATASSKTTLKCLKVDEDTHGSSGSVWRSALVMVQVLEHCQKSYRCLRFQFRNSETAPHLLLIQTSENVEETENCSTLAFHSNMSEIVVSQSIQPGSCPFTGRYISSVDSRGCQLELQSGCRGQSTMTLKSSCQGYPILQLTCLKWWGVQQKLFLLAVQATHEDHQQFACYSFYAYNGSMRINVEENCDFVSTTSSNDVSYEFYYRLDHCLSTSEENGQQSWSSPNPNTKDANKSTILLPSKSPRLVHNPDPPEKDNRQRDAAENSPRRNHLSAAAFSAAASTISFPLSRVLYAFIICLWVSGARFTQAELQTVLYGSQRS